VQPYVTCCVTLAIEKITVRHRLWMIFGGFLLIPFTVSIRNNLTITCFTVSLCSCISSSGSEEPLLFYLLYSFVPTKQTKGKGTYFFYTPQKVDRQIYCIIMYFSCYVM
jgi:hypothetical protein